MSSFTADWAKLCSGHQTSWCIEDVHNAVIESLTPTVRGSGEDVYVASPAFRSEFVLQPTPYPNFRKGEHVFLTVWNGTVMTVTGQGYTDTTADAPGWNYGSVAGTLAGIVLEAIAVNVFLAQFRKYRIDRHFATATSAGTFPS